MEPNKVRIVCVSDTHNAHSSISLPKGDILIHAGDLTNQGSYSELKKAIEWISQADFATKIVVAGNHDLSLDAEYALKHKEGWSVIPTDVVPCRDLMLSNPDIVYLQHTDAMIPIPGTDDLALRVFGSPYSPDRGKQNWAFQYEEDAAESIWDAVPVNTDILITHTPPAGHCDESLHWQEGGCSFLTTALSRIRPLLHICGHCHEGRGAEVVAWDNRPNNIQTALRKWQDPGAGNRKQSIVDLTGKTTNNEPVHRGKETAIVNASVMANSHGRGKAFNKPIVIDLPLHQQTAERRKLTTQQRGDGISCSD